MFFKDNLKPFIFLIFFTISAIFLYHFDYLDTELSVTHNNYDYDEHLVTPLVSGDAVGALTQNGPDSIMRCRLDVVKTFNLCGVSIKLGGEKVDSGINVGRYNRLELELAYSAPIENPKVKVSFRNFNSNYALITDPISLKFNTIIFATSKYNDFIKVPLDVFQVENWWLEQYKIDFKDSPVDLSNVSSLEFLSHGMPVAGDYEIYIKEITLRGELITEYGLFKLIVAVWLTVGLMLLLRQHQKLNEISKRDMLTGLYNRRGIQGESNIIKADNNTYMFYIGINDFKKINDAYGHEVGDSVLIDFSRYLERKVEKIKRHSYISRFSGDEFLIVFDNISREEMLAIALSLTAEKEMQFAINSYNVSISISLGIAETKDVSSNFDILLSRSGAAMYHVKSNKVFSFQEFDQAFSDNIYFRKRISEFIKDALLNDQFSLNYMPIYDAKSLDVYAFEVLLRCQSNDMENIGPDIFIPIAEEYNLIREIDFWVIEHAFKSIRDNYSFLRENEIKNEKPTIFCINISAEQLRNSFFVDALSKLIIEYNVPPEWVELELTETSFVEIDQKSIDILTGIRALGVTLALDDFGTGYISFNQLVHYPVNCLKVDKSFVDLLETENNSSEMIIRAILSMADSYKLHTVGEGVETSEQYTYLLEAGCRLVQGYLFSKPVPWPLAKELLIRPREETIKQISMLG